MRKIGILGGTFDPPHLGHLILGEEAYFQIKLDELLFVLTPEPPHKQDQKITHVKIREEMLSAAIHGNPSFHLSRVDIDRSAPHYAVDTVKIIQAENPAASVGYIMGGDSLHDLPTWHSAREFVAAVDFIGVMRRPAVDINLESLEAQLPGIQKKVTFVDAALLKISSSEIKERVKKNRPFRYFVPEMVYSLILENSLYSSDP